MRVRKLAFVTLTVAAALSLTACQDDETGAPTATAPTGSAASTASTAPSGSPAKGGAASTPAPTGTGGAAKTAKCRTEDLTITAADRTIGGDAENTVAVELKNHSGKDCAISGYAGVDLQTSAGPLSAQRSGEPVVASVLKAGKSTYFGISYPANTSGGSGIRITGLVITPPDETRSVTLAWPGAGSLPVTDGSGSPVKIGPMGSAGQGE
ncbi:DUF4232 domain-containing protein [Kitasatospora sp. NA04385]|uniref:DUF4232 domain-containing protein n=1 Tax=Kitasatospora sp. NA04385 TaxID=2742135 RepID=UPI001590E564|nr:DUF4232 domain-containing protein [Kitasatospora sp. NA04385]QKW22451.1 DUF4232 domain-containing protein [Kitasatospora sp. NA04385]